MDFDFSKSGTVCRDSIIFENPGSTSTCTAVMLGDLWWAVGHIHSCLYIRIYFIRISRLKCAKF